MNSFEKGEAERDGQIERPRAPHAALPIRWLVRGLEVVVVILMAIIVAVVMTEVALRWFAAGASLIITDELTRYLMIWTAMLAAALVVYEDGHVRISLLPNAMPRWARMVLRICSQLVVLFFLGVLIVVSLMILPETMSQMTIALGVSVAWFTAALPVSAAIMAILIFYDIICTIRRYRDG